MLRIPDTIGSNFRHSFLLRNITNLDSNFSEWHSIGLEQAYYNKTIVILYKNLLGIMETRTKNLCFAYSLLSTLMKCISEMLYIFGKLIFLFYSIVWALPTAPK